MDLSPKLAGSETLAGSAIGPIFSMTGYSSVQADVAGGVLALEFRSVNHRFLDLTVKLPEDLRAFETPLREAMQSQLTRGKVECRFTFVATGGGQDLTIDTNLLQRLIAASQQIEPFCTNSRSIAVMDWMRWPGVLMQPKQRPEEWLSTLTQLAQRGLEELNATRRREGTKLAEGLLAKAAYMGQLIHQVKGRLPRVLQSYQDKMRARLQEVMQNAVAVLDEERIRQEVALFANRVDVYEELDRTEVHLVELRRILGQGGAVGKRLDFLLQELNREANTLASKSVDIQVTQLALEAKVTIEQMREQIQNLE